MLYNRKSRDKPMHLWSPKIWQRRQEYKRRKTASSRSRARKSGQLMLKKKKLEHYPTSLLLLLSHPVMSNCLWPQGLQHTSSMSFTICWSLPKFMPIASVMPNRHLILWHPLLLLPSILPSIRDFSNSDHIRWSKYWSFSFSISPSNEYSELFSLKIDWFVNTSYVSYIRQWNYNLKILILRQVKIRWYWIDINIKHGMQA